MARLHLTVALAPTGLFSGAGARPMYGQFAAFALSDDERIAGASLRVLVDGRELLISQFLFDDALNDMIFSSDADYADAARHEEPFSESEVDQFNFRCRKTRHHGTLQATFTIGLAAQS